MRPYRYAFALALVVVVVPVVVVLLLSLCRVQYIFVVVVVCRSRPSWLSKLSEKGRALSISMSVFVLIVLKLLRFASNHARTPLSDELLEQPICTTQMRHVRPSLSRLNTNILRCTKWLQEYFCDVLCLSPRFGDIFQTNGENWILWGIHLPEALHASVVKCTRKGYISISY
jgi:hypothetical protein